MIKDIKELRIRLQTHFEVLFHADEEHTDPLGMALLSAIDLVNLIEKGEFQTVKEVLGAWRTRDENGDAGTPSLIRFPREHDERNYGLTKQKQREATACFPWDPGYERLRASIPASRHRKSC